MVQEYRNLEDFSKAVTGSIKEYLPEVYRAATVELQMVVKNNDTKLTGLVIRLADSQMCPTIYLDGYFELYKDFGDFKAVLKRIAQARVEHERNLGINVEGILDYSQAMERIVPRLVNFERNQELLHNKPYKALEDLAVIYYIELGENEGGTMSTAVSEELMNRWGVTVEELHRQAVRNIETMKKGKINTMFEALQGIMGDIGEDMEGADMLMGADDDFMYIISSRGGIYGAAQVLNKDLMEQAEKKLGDKIILLPSSVHEFIAVKFDGSMDAMDLKNMVEEVNGSEVKPDEYLSDHVYLWEKGKGLRIYR